MFTIDVINAVATSFINEWKQVGFLEDCNLTVFLDDKEIYTGHVPFPEVLNRYVDNGANRFILTGSCHQAMTQTLLELGAKYQKNDAGGFFYVCIDTLEVYFELNITTVHPERKFINRKLYERFFDLILYARVELLTQRSRRVIAHDDHNIDFYMDHDETLTYSFQTGPDKYCITLRIQRELSDT